MKKINFLFVVLMVASLFVPVWADSYDITTNYYTYYESHDSVYWFYDVAATEDGGYIAVGLTKVKHDSYYEDGKVIVKYDSNHEIEWKKEEEQEGKYDDKVIVTSDAGYVMLGHSDTNIAKYDNEGNKIWEKEEDIPAITDGKYGWYYYEFLDVVEYNGNYFVVARKYHSSEDGSGYVDKSMVVKYDSDGNEIGSNEYDNGFNTIEVTSDGGYVLAGNGVIKKYDSSGNEELSIDSVDYNVNDIKQTSDGGYIVVGDNYIVKYDSEGKEEWWDINQNDDIVYNSVSMNDDGFIAVGYAKIVRDYYGEEYNYSAIYTVYDTEGNLLKSDSYSGDEDTYFGGVDTLNNGSYVIAGYLEADDLYEIKLNGDCDGLILNVITPVSEQSETSSSTTETKTETSNYLIWIIVIVVIVILVLVYYNKKKKTKSDKIKKNEK